MSGASSPSSSLLGRADWNNSPVPLLADEFQESILRKGRLPWLKKGQRQAKQEELAAKQRAIALKTQALAVIPRSSSTFALEPPPEPEELRERERRREQRRRRDARERKLHAALVRDQQKRFRELLAKETERRAALAALGRAKAAKLEPLENDSSRTASPTRTSSPESVRLGSYNGAPYRPGSRELNFCTPIAPGYKLHQKPLLPDNEARRRIISAQEEYTKMRKQDRQEELRVRQALLVPGAIKSVSEWPDGETKRRLMDSCKQHIAKRQQVLHEEHMKKSWWLGGGGGHTKKSGWRSPKAAKRFDDLRNSFNKRQEELRVEAASVGDVWLTPEQRLEKQWQMELADETRRQASGPGEDSGDSEDEGEGGGERGDTVDVQDDAQEVEPTAASNSETEQQQDNPGVGSNDGEGSQSLPGQDEGTHAGSSDVDGGSRDETAGQGQE
eukprot:CAMPEP_0114547988 /NCGR_PEP_ID=MMETSP0114-20121206/4744_1 /TAXON_ID=31324 /ORGANISM="Goniomonas sp, Strain m" /LENGTH=444 /DNA_ID=CAMNT_0001732553 /DNA_START=32 /DNA_END=1363 /DNA_ORIENTATION=-